MTDAFYDPERCVCMAVTVCAGELLWAIPKARGGSPLGDGRSAQQRSALARWQWGCIFDTPARWAWRRWGLAPWQEGIGWARGGAEQAAAGLGMAPGMIANRWRWRRRPALAQATVRCLSLAVREVVGMMVGCDGGGGPRQYAITP